MRAMVLRNSQLTIEDVSAPKPGPMQVLTRVLACGICGSDLHAARFLEEMIENTNRASGRSAWNTLDTSRPIIMGHEYVAEVVEAGPGAEMWEPGARVTAMPILFDASAPNGFYALGYASEAGGAFAETLLLSSPLLLRVPESVSDAAAATTEPLAVGLHNVREARMQPGEHAVVMGAGPIGLMTLLWLKKEGVAHVTVSDPSPERRALAARLGANLVVDPRSTNLADAVFAAAGSAAPVVFECVGVPGTLEEAMELVARQGRVIVAGVCMHEDAIRPMVGINKHLTLQFVLGYTPQEFAESLAALGDGSIDTTPLVTRLVSLDDLPAAFTALADPRDCKVMLRF